LLVKIQKYFVSKKFKKSKINFFVHFYPNLPKKCKKPDQKWLREDLEKVNDSNFFN
jgi:hypothetical protein